MTSKWAFFQPPSILLICHRCFLLLLLFLFGCSQAVAFTIDLALYFVLWLCITLESRVLYSFSSCTSTIYFVCDEPMTVVGSIMARARASVQGWVCVMTMREKTRTRIGVREWKWWWMSGYGGWWWYFCGECIQFNGLKFISWRQSLKNKSIVTLYMQ